MKTFIENISIAVARFLSYKNCILKLTRGLLQFPILSFYVHHVVSEKQFVNAHQFSSEDILSLLPQSWQVLWLHPDGYRVYPDQNRSGLI